MDGRFKDDATEIKCSPTRGEGGGGEGGEGEGGKT